METKSEVKESALSSEAVALAKKYAELKKERDEYELKAEAVEQEMNHVRMTLKDKMVELELQNFKLEGFGTYYLQTSFYLKPVDKEKLIAWLDERNLGTVAPRTVHVPSLREEYERRVENDKDLPSSDLVNAYSETDVRLRATK